MICGDGVWTIATEKGDLRVEVDRVGRIVYEVTWGVVTSVLPLHVHQQVMSCTLISVFP
jgi:hypothetical protein